MIPFPPWEPDKGPHSAVSTDYVRNAIPASNGWRAFKAFAATSVALASRPTGIIFARGADGFSNVIVGTNTAMYNAVVSSGLTTWADISKSGGYSNANWNFTQFGTKVIGVSRAIAPQVWDMDAGGLFADLGGSPPTAKYIATVGDFVVLANTADGTRRVQWSGQNNQAFWTVGQQSADYQVMPDGDEIMGIISVPGGARIFQRNAIRAMAFAPQSGFVFTFEVVTKERGAVAQNAIINIGRGDYLFLADDGFYRGDQGTPIGAEKVNRYFLDDVDQDSIETVRGAADFQNKTAWWEYRASTGDRRIIGYNWQLDRWSLLDLGATFYLVNGATSAFGISIDSIDDTLGNLETLDTTSLDSLSYTTGLVSFPAFNGSFALGYFNGPPVAATIRTQDVELTPGRRSFVRGFRLVADIDSDVSTTFTGRIDTRAYSGGPVTTGSTAASSAVTGLCPMRHDGRFHRFEVQTGASFRIAHGVDPEYMPAGQR